MPLSKTPKVDTKADRGFGRSFITASYNWFRLAKTKKDSCLQNKSKKEKSTALSVYLKRTPNPKQILLAIKISKRGFKIPFGLVMIPNKITCTFKKADQSYFYITNFRKFKFY